MQNKFFTDNTIRVESVTLKIKDMKRSLDFYVDKLGFKLISNKDNVYNLGVDNNILVTLVEDTNATPKAPTSGLYHFALLLPNRKYLGQLINHFIRINLPIIGGSDHGVSEALYLNDPDGNGIEIYSDREDTSWEYDNGEVIMGSEQLDYQSLIQVSYQKLWEGLPSETIMGHVHYHVATLSEAANFFIDVIGFNQMLLYGGSALFLSSDNYHHHLGLNTWAGTNVLNRPNEMVGLISYKLKTGNKLEELIRRINEHNITILNDELGTYVFDVNNCKVYF